jgi:formate dehydrogenase major subunit
VVKLQSLLDDLAGARSVSLPLGAGNVQGLVAMGVAPDVLPGGDLVTDAEARQRLADAWGVASLPAEPGRSTAEIVAALGDGSLRAAWVWANEAASFGAADDLLAALGKAAFVVVQGAVRGDLAEAADVVLPAVAWGEEDGTFTNAERRISRLRRVQRPPAAARPGWWAFREVARRLGHEWQAGYPKAVWEDEISLLIPSLGGVTYAELDEFGLCWPAPAPVTA